MEVLDESGEEFTCARIFRPFNLGEYRGRDVVLVFDDHACDNNISRMTNNRGCYAEPAKNYFSQLSVFV
jgi:hypothetical protein